MATLADLRVRLDDQVSAAAGAVATSLERVAKASERVAAGTATQDETLRRAGRSYESVARQIDGATAARAKEEVAAKRHEAAILAVNRAVERGKITTEEASRQIERLGLVRDQEIAKAQALSAAIEGRFAPAQQVLARSTNGTAMAMRNLGIQSIDVFQQLASGAPIMMTLVQQGGQVAQMAAVTGTSLGSLAKSVGSLVLANLPLIGVLTGAAGVVGALALVGARSVELEGQQRALSVAIRGVGRSAEFSVSGLQGYVTALRQQGVAAADAVKAVADLVRNTGVSGATASRIVSLGPDAAAALGVGVPDAMKSLADGARGSIESIQKLADAFNLLSPAEDASIRQMITHGDQAKALETVFDKLQSRVSGLARDALSPSEQAMRDLGNSWTRFVDSVANSEVVIKAIERLAGAIRSIADLITPGQTTPQSQIGDIDSRLVAMSGTIPGANATAARLRREQVEARAALLRQRGELAQGIADASEFGYGIPPSVTVPIPGELSTAQRLEISRRAASDISGSTPGKIDALTQKNKEYRAELARLDPAISGNTQLINTYTQAISANEKELEELRKKEAGTRSGMEKTRDTLEAQIKAQQALTAAYRQGGDAIARVLAVQEAEKKAISDGLQPGTATYADAVSGLTDQYIRLAQATGEAQIAKTIEETERATGAQKRIAEAYDGTTRSIELATDQEKAYAAALKANLQPGTAEFASSVERLSAAFQRATEGSNLFRQAQQSVAAITDMLGTAFDRLGQGIVDAFVSGRGAAVNFGNIARAVMGSVLSDLARLAVINPIRNAVFGGNAATLAAATGAGSASGGGLFGSLGNVLSIGRLSDSLGFTNIGGSISNFLGFGEGGFFSGIGNSISGFLNAPILGQAAAMQATNSALAGLGAGVYGPATPSSVGLAGTTFGQILGGIGGGFALGSLGGGFLQSSLGRTGPGPTIGAGVGAVGGTVIGSLLGGPVLGGILGGLLGGGGGAFFGPGQANPFSATGLNMGSDGMLSVGRTFSQIVDTSGEVNTLTQQIAQLNAVMSQFGARITNGFSRDEFGQARLIGGRSGQWLNFGQGGGRPGDLTGAFGELRFGSDNPQLQRLLSREFSGVEDLAQALQEAATFLNDTAPALKIMGSTETSFGVGSLAKDIETLNKQFGDAVTIAEKLGWAEYDLNAAREQAVKTANDNVARQFNLLDQQFISRRLTAQGSVSNDPALQLTGALIAFDLQAEDQRRTFRDQLRAAFGDAVTETEGFAVQMALLEETLGAERLATAKSYQDAIAAQAQRSAQGAIAIVGSIRDYVRGITLGGDSVIPAQERYALARGEFEATLASARGGDATALSSLTSVAENFRTQSRAVYGSGTQAVSDVRSIIAALQSVATMSADALSNAVFASETRSQTETLATRLDGVRSDLANVADVLRRVMSGPPAARAA